MSRPLKAMYCSIGWFFVGLGLVGVILPVLPTTPFMLLALWMFSKGSRRFHDWLFNHRLFGGPLQKWQAHRVIPLPAKLCSTSMMLLSFIMMVIYSPMGWWLHALVGFLMLYGAWFVLSKPSRTPENVVQESVS